MFQIFLDLQLHLGNNSYTNHIDEKGYRWEK
jgi:hypothetical protein